MKFGPLFFIIGAVVIIGLVSSAPDRAPVGAMVIVWLVGNALALHHNATRSR